MLPEGIKPGSPAHWLLHAKGDLALAKAAETPDVLLELLCFHAQQAVEKSIKAVLVSRGIQISKTHNVKTLIELLPADVPIHDDVMLAAKLTEYAVANRYPGDETEAIGEDEYEEAVRLAESCCDWASKLVG